MDVNNNNNDVVVVNPPGGVRQDIIDKVNRWRESLDVKRTLFIWPSCNQHEAIFVADSLRRYLPLEANSGNNPQTTTLFLCPANNGHGFSDAAIDVFCGFLQETPCHLVSLQLRTFPTQQSRRLLEALHTNTSVKELIFDALHENDGNLFEELLRHKTDFTYLSLMDCHIPDALTGLLSGLTQLKELDFYSCNFDNEAVRVILQHRYPFITKLVLSDTRITSSGLLGFMAHRIPDALPNLEMLFLDHNPDLLNNPENTQLFAKNVMPLLKELHLIECGQDSAYIPIIKVCEAAETMNKLELLDITARPFQAIRKQLVESLPKMKVKCLRCAQRVFTRSDQTLMSALYKNTSIVELGGIIYDNETRRHVAPILQRNKISANIDVHLLLPESSVNNHATNNIEDDGCSIITPLGRWSRVLAEVGHRERVPLGATPVYKILQAALGPWLEEMKQPKQDVMQQQDHDQSGPFEPVAQPETSRIAIAAVVGDNISLVGLPTVVIGTTQPPIGVVNDDIELAASVQDDSSVADGDLTRGNLFQPEVSGQGSHVMMGDPSTTTAAAATATTATTANSTTLTSTEQQRSQSSGGQKRVATPMMENKSKKPNSEGM